MSRPTGGVVAIMAASRRGTVLAGRYKIIEIIEAGTFKGHDLALDQTVMVRQVSPETQGLQNAQQSVLIPNPTFLNILEVVSENSNEFIIIEWVRGRSVGDLLGGAISINMGGPVESVRNNGVASRKHSVPLPQTGEVIRKFDRDTGWVATTVLVMVIFGAVGLAMQIKERHPETVYLDNSFALFKGMERSSGQPSGQKTPVRLDDMDRALIQTSSSVDPSPQMETPAPTSPTVSVLTVTKNHCHRKWNPGSWAPIQGSESSPEMKLTVPSARFRSSVRPKIVDVKKRLVALWRASLAREERMSGWNISENSKSKHRKNVSYTAEIDHGG